MFMYRGAVLAFGEAVSHHRRAGDRDHCGDDPYIIDKDKTRLEGGIKYTSKKILQYAVILLGFGLNLQVILQTGKQSLPIIVSTIATSLIIAYVLHKVMRIPGKISTLWWEWDPRSAGARPSRLRRR